MSLVPIFSFMKFIFSGLIFQSLIYGFSFYFIVIGKDLCKNFSFLKFVKTFLWTNTWSTLENVLSAHENYVFWSTWVEYFADICQVHLIIVLFKSTASLLIFCLIFYLSSKGEYWNLLLLLCAISPFSSINICFIYLGALILDAHIYKIVISLLEIRNQ